MGKRVLAAIGVCLVLLALLAGLIDMVNGGWGWEPGSPEAIFSSQAYFALGLTKPVNPYTQCSPEEEQRIWDFLLGLTDNSIGAAALMGNLAKESGLAATNMENAYEEVMGYDDLSYTAAADSGRYQRFTTDGVGYGLAQWTYPSRKERLLTLARERGTSVGDLGTQLELIALELAETSILEDLKTAASIPEASDIVMLRYERPADQSEETRQRRAGACQYFYQKYALGWYQDGTMTLKQQQVTQIAMNSSDYGIRAVSGYCQAWAADVYEAAGLPRDGSASAYQSGIRFGVSSDWTAIPPGAAVYGYSNNQYGHVGIYVGNGLVYHVLDGVVVDTLEDWVRIYKGFCWGWEGGSDLTLFD